MKLCLDCGRLTRAQAGICRTCEQKRRLQKRKDAEKFREAVDSVWERMKS